MVYRKKDVVISKSKTNIFHFILITKNEVKIKDKWIKAQAIDTNSNNTSNRYKNIAIKSNINNENIKKAYLYIKISAKWLENKNVSREKLKVDIIINNQRKTLPIFYLYEKKW